MDDQFKFVHIRVDLEGNELDFTSQVLGLGIDYFDSWSFEVAYDVITFIYIWDYESSTTVPEEVDDPLADDNEMLATWIGEVILQFEEIDVENHLMFIATTGGFTAGKCNGRVKRLRLLPLSNGKYCIIYRRTKAPCY